MSSSHSDAPSSAPLRMPRAVERSSGTLAGGDNAEAEQADAEQRQ